MAHSRQRMKGRREAGRYIGIPERVMQSPNWIAMSAHGVKLLMEFALQYNGYNNGNLHAAHAVLSKRGWNSKDTLNTSRREVEHYGFVEITRPGGRHACTLYALTWQPIDACSGKFTPTSVPSGLWKQPAEPFQRGKKNENAGPPAGPPRTASRSSLIKIAA